MKLQIQGQQLRWRIDEAELATLLAGEPVGDTTGLPGARDWRRALQLVSGDAPCLQCDDDHWLLTLPRAPVERLAQSLPSRDGLSFALMLGNGTPLELRFDVDIRDSRRQRRPPEA